MTTEDIEDIQPKHKKCPHCAEEILVDAKVCKHCGRDVSPASSDKNLHENYDEASKSRNRRLIGIAGVVILAIGSVPCIEACIGLLRFFPEI